MAYLRVFMVHSINGVQMKVISSFMYMRCTAYIKQLVYKFLFVSSQGRWECCLIMTCIALDMYVLYGTERYITVWFLSRVKVTGSLSDSPTKIFRVVPTSLTSLVIF